MPNRDPATQERGRVRLCNAVPAWVEPTYEGMAARVRARVEAQQHLLAVVGHELRSPLARVQVHVDLAREGLQPHRHLDGIETALSEIAQLVDDLLASARLDFDALADDVVDLVAVARRAAGERDVTVSGQGRLRGDPTLLLRLFELLIDNAFRHGAAPVRMTVTDAERVSVVVDDAGQGFGADPERYLRPFARGEGGGIGLGLALAERIARAHRGAITLGKAPGGGGRVTVRLGPPKGQG